MEFVFEDFQILLFNDISPERLEKIIKPDEQYCYMELMDEIKSSIS